MKFESPEKLGISSENIYELIKSFEDAGLNMHACIIARHGKICHENYWAPFNKDFAHRLYSITKSFVAIAVGFAIQDGLIDDINDPVIKYFPEYEKTAANDLVKKQTVRNMLMMSTSRLLPYWFGLGVNDRLKFYFESEGTGIKTPGTVFEYDSNGSYVLGALVEKLSGKSLLDYLKEKLFTKIGMSDNIDCLQCAGGHAWGDSALIMPARDLLKFAMFVLNDGNFEGQQLLDARFVKDAHSKLIDNVEKGANTYDNKGYGYQIWQTYDEGFCFNGMGGQFVICVPDKDLIFLCNADNQGVLYANKHIFDKFFELIARKCSDTELPENTEAKEKLDSYCANLKLSIAKGETKSSWADEINGRVIKLRENPMGIKDVCLKFDGDEGVLCYTNAQGYKELNFGLGKNVFSKFPEDGYSDRIGGLRAAGNKYDCAASAAWVEERKLFIRVQIIDKYFGNAQFIFGFNEEGKLGVYMQKIAEDFLNEYQGFAAELAKHKS